MKGVQVMSSTGGPGTVIGLNVAINGILKEQDDIEVHGIVDGELNSERSIVIGETAKIKGPVRATNITVGGVVDGSVQAVEKLEILETGKVTGSISTKDLVIRSGAIFVGDCQMSSGQEAVKKEEKEEVKEVEEKEDKEDEDILAPDKE